MKRVGILLAVLFGWVHGAHAQSADIYKLVPGEGSINIEIGPFVSGGECFNTGPVAAGTNALAGFAFSTGADFEFPLTWNISFSLALAYDARSVNFQQTANPANIANYNFNYAVIRPELSFSGFMIGAGFGIPVSSGVSGPGTAGSPTNFGTSAMNTLFEIRFGASIPVMRSTNGVLDLKLEVGCPLTQISSYELNPSGATENTASAINNGPLITAEIGFQYLFDLKPH